MILNFNHHVYRGHEYKYTKYLNTLICKRSSNSQKWLIGYITTYKPFEGYFMPKGEGIAFIICTYLHFFV